MRMNAWRDLLQSKGCIQGNQIVAPKDCRINLYFSGNGPLTSIGPDVQSDEKTVLEFTDQIITDKRIVTRSGTSYYDTFYLWEDLCSVQIVRHSR